MSIYRAILETPKESHDKSQGAIFEQTDIE